jgi:hypothetical protein
MHRRRYDKPVSLDIFTQNSSFLYFLLTPQFSGKNTGNGHIRRYDKPVSSDIFTQNSSFLYFLLTPHFSVTNGRRRRIQRYDKLVSLDIFTQNSSFLYFLLTYLSHPNLLRNGSQNNVPLTNILLLTKMSKKMSKIHFRVSKVFFVQTFQRL